MDIIRAIHELYEEKKRLDAAIAYLESLPKERPARKRSGAGATPRRKGTPPLQVSETMVQFWQNRKD